MSFSTDIKVWGIKTGAKIQNTRRGVIIKLFNAVILDTPVLTGRARGNWLFSIGQPKLSPIDREDKSGAGPIAEVQAGVQQSDGDVTCTLSNNLPYIKRLEEGYSRKAPAGMVRKNIARFARLIQIKAQS